MASQAHLDVFATPELLEQILLHLSLPSLLLIKRVSRSFKNTIDSSLKLQQALFLAPVPSSTKPYFNPLLRSVFPPFFRHCYSIHSLDHLPEELSSLPWYRMEGGEDTLDPVLRKEASWRKMYPVQPPARISSVGVSSTCGCAWLSYKGVFSDKKDTQRMGCLYDVAIHLQDSFNGQVGFQWNMFKPEGETKEEKECWAQHEKYHTHVFQNEIKVINLHYKDCYAKVTLRHVLPCGFKSDGDEFEKWDLGWDEVPEGYDYPFVGS